MVGNFSQLFLVEYFSQFIRTFSNKNFLKKQKKNLQKFPINYNFTIITTKVGQYWFFLKKKKKKTLLLSYL